MALTEQRVLQSVTLRIDTQTIEVCWADLILRDGEVISRVPARRAYSREAQQDYLDDLAQYPTAPYAIPAIGWDIVPEA